MIGFLPVGRGPYGGVTAADWVSILLDVPHFPLRHVCRPTPANHAEPHSVRQDSTGRSGVQTALTAILLTVLISQFGLSAREVHFSPINPGLFDLRHHLQRIAGRHDERGLLAGLQ